MNDYKELVENLREEADAVQAIEWDIPICTENHIREAADAIEQLVKERDAAVADISLLIINHGNACKICKHHFSDDPTLCLECDEMCLHGNYEWRGVLK